MSDMVQAATVGISDLRDPFNSEHCEKVTMWIRKNWSGVIVFEATVYFQNGPTNGEHNITADSFPDLVRKVELFTTSLSK